MKVQSNVQPSCVKARGSRTVKRPGVLSCITIEKTAHGRLVGAEHFDVPAEDYGDGNITGNQLASEFLDAIQAGKRGFDPLRVIEDACKALGEGEDEDGAVGSAAESRLGAAVGFLRTLEGLLKKVAQAGLHEPHVRQTIENALEWRRKDAQAAEDEKADFVRRMKSAKAAKAEALLSPGNLPGN